LGSCATRSRPPPSTPLPYTTLFRSVGPFGVDVVIQGMLIGPFDVSLVVATTWPPAVSVNDRLPAAAFSIQTTTHTVPVTVAPFEGCVMNTEIVPVLFCTVTVRMADAVARGVWGRVRAGVS